jgi:SAM-dependent methyltransferase
MSTPYHASSLTLDNEGIWVSSDCLELSYPEDGNEHCFLIEGTSFWFQHRNNCIVAALKLHPPTGPILDVGGGNGYVTRRLLDEGFEAALVEPGPVGARNARRERRIPTVFCATLEGCGFPPESVDAIGLFDVLEHIDDEARFLATAHSILKPHGRIYLTVPAFNWLWSTNDDTGGHYRRYSPGALINALSSQFDVLFLTCFFRALSLPILAFRVAPYRLGLVKHRAKVLSTETEHGTGGSPWVKLIKKLLSHESRAIASGRSMKWGTSCLCIATKATQHD